MRLSAAGSPREARDAIVTGLARHWRALVDRFGNALVAANALALMLASWMPGSHIVRSGFLSAHVEHTLCYTASGAFLLAVLAGRCAAWQVAAGLAAYGGILELGQIFVPGRHARIDDFLFSAAGTVAGVLACAALFRRFAPDGK